MKFRIYTDKQGQHRWRLTTDKGTVWVRSIKGFGSRSAAQKDARHIRDSLNEILK